jgi:hypothetical protein
MKKKIRSGFKSEYCIVFSEKGKNKQDIIIVPRKFKVNDKVRLRLKKKVFDKSDVRYYSKEIYIV